MKGGCGQLIVHDEVWGWHCQINVWNVTFPLLNFVTKPLGILNKIVLIINVHSRGKRVKKLYMYLLELNNQIVLLSITESEFQLKGFKV